MFLVVCQLSCDVLALKTRNVIGAFDPSIVTVKQSSIVSQIVSCPDRRSLLVRFA